LEEFPKANACNVYGPFIGASDDTLGSIAINRHGPQNFGKRTINSVGEIRSAARIDTACPVCLSPASSVGCATTYKWHPTSEAPPLFGLVFENAEAGMQIFRDAQREMNHEDRFEEIRLAIIEGEVPGQEHRPGYSVHLCADPEAVAAHATFDDFVVDPSVVPFLGQWNRHYPVPGAPSLLPRFKEEFEKHGEFMLAPAVRHNDGLLYMESSVGIIKNVLLFRQLAEITTPDDPDAAALLLPQFITPPV
jgi:hypothetical protein